MGRRRGRSRDGDWPAPATSTRTPVGGRTSGTNGGRGRVVGGEGATGCRPPTSRSGFSRRPETVLCAPDANAARPSARLPARSPARQPTVGARPHERRVVARQHGRHCCAPSRRSIRISESPVRRHFPCPARAWRSDNTTCFFF